ncbi:uncharacterized protein LOC117641228 [Thrips palmi]|uniref:Uncharacterized protein LOC117641228 n=1 Tax=Thrips palmi TaxID=161013 RepID=A0A6P8ZIV7_THRPL|nr:uncharacterized protein LOC117641228 [Thrips palmi]
MWTTMHPRPLWKHVEMPEASQRDTKMPLQAIQQKWHMAGQEPLNTSTNSFLCGILDYIETSTSGHSYFKPIGGVGKIVEIDEAVFGKQKDRLGRTLEVQWVFGGVERGLSSSKFFLQPVAQRDADTLVTIILRCILPGTTIMSDGWKAYARLNEKGYRVNLNNEPHWNVDFSRDKENIPPRN